VKSEITKKIFLCSVSGRPFILQRGEVAFYQKHNLPLPRKHYDVRHAERMKLRPGLDMYLQTCDKCGVEMLSAYAEK